MTDAAATVRTLLLPLSESNFAAAVESVSRLLDSWGIDESDRALYIEELLGEWRASLVPSLRLRRLIMIALDAETLLPSGFAQKYFSAISKLHSNTSLLTFEQAVGLLSNTLRINNFLVRDGMSAAQVALVLNASQNTSGLTWRHVQVISDALGSRPVLDVALVAQVHEQDHLDEPANFADASPEESIQTLARRAVELGYPGDMADELERFLGEDRHLESAFAIILHVNALITQFFDHPLSQAAYEFEPRGAVISETMRSAHPSYQAAESPYLNNAKGTFAFDSNWAWGRKENNRRQAHALVELLDGLGEMAYQQRRELAGWVRQWLLRMERLRSATFAQVSQVTDDGARSAIRRISHSNTSTQGVLEQRLLDLVVLSSYRAEEGWRFRGIGDAVNASNVAKKKLGDVEAENTGRRRILAFEPHGGKLTEVYVNRHRNTLAQVVSLRQQEFEAIAPLDDWMIRVLFIAHDISGRSDFDEEVLGINIEYRFTTYEDFLALNPLDGTAVGRFSELIAEPTDKPWIPDAIKSALNSAMTFQPDD